MATSKKSLSNMTSLSEEDNPKKRKQSPPPSEDQLKNFGMFSGSTDVKQQALYLAKKGFVGADQLLTDHPDLTTRNGIINAQSDWKPAAISAMLVRARKIGLKTPTEIMANRAALTGALDQKSQEAVNHPVFNQIHPNFWDTFNGVLKDQYDNESKQPMPSSLATALVKK